jgi:hypothetical protein
MFAVDGDGQLSEGPVHVLRAAVVAQLSVFLSSRVCRRIASPVIILGFRVPVLERLG